jgi:cobalt-zinc-cadmium efflux system outer membrane protein
VSKLISPIVIVMLIVAPFARAGGGVLTLREAVARSMTASPELAAFPYEERAADARILQAGIRPNPEASLRVENFGLTHQIGEANESTLELSQLLELGGKRRARLRDAQAGKALVRFDYEAKRLEVMANTAQAFYEVLGAQRRVALNEEVVKLAAEIAPEIQKRVEAGKASAVEQTRNDVAVASARIGLEQAKHDLTAARRKLAAKWGVNQPDFAGVSGDLEHCSPPLALANYLARLSVNPAIARWSAEVDKRQAALAREKAEGNPDLTIGGGPRWLAGESTVGFVAGVSIPLPLHNKNAGAIREAEVEVQKVAVDRKAAEANLIAEAGEIYEDMAKAYEEIQILTADVLPNARKTMDAVKEAYAAGKLSQLDILEARRTINEARLQHLQALVEYHKAGARLDALAGPATKTFVK